MTEFWRRWTRRHGRAEEFSRRKGDFIRPLAALHKRMALPGKGYEADGWRHSLHRKLQG